MPKKDRKVFERDGKFYTQKGIELTRCSNTMTESEFFSWILSNARKLTLRWKPRNDALNMARRPYSGPDKRTKWEYQCSQCVDWFPKKMVEADHITPCGGMKSYESISLWYKRALVEMLDFKVLCKTCHNSKTQRER